MNPEKIILQVTVDGIHPQSETLTGISSVAERYGTKGLIFPLAQIMVRDIVVIPSEVSIKLPYATITVAKRGCVV